MNQEQINKLTGTNKQVYDLLNDLRQFIDIDAIEYLGKENKWYSKTDIYDSGKINIDIIKLKELNNEIKLPMDDYDTRDYTLEHIKYTINRLSSNKDYIGRLLNNILNKLATLDNIINNLQSDNDKKIILNIFKWYEIDYKTLYKKINYYNQRYGQLLTEYDKIKATINIKTKYLKYKIKYLRLKKSL
jgi:hypothetical protein